MGVGFAGCHYVSGSSKPVNRSNMPHATVTLKLDTDASITLFTGAAEIGQGSSTVMMQIAAETIGVGPERFRVVAADSALTPKDNGSYSSRVTLYVGNATLDAATKMRTILFDAAARALHVFPADLELVDEEFRIIAEPDKRLSFNDAVEAALNTKARSSRKEPTPRPRSPTAATRTAVPASARHRPSATPPRWSKWTWT
jgi:4-hydroxybenzoyl-CoA reductase subunit alpha